MTVAGDKRILTTQTLLLADDEVGQFDLLVGDTTLTVRVRFTAPDDPEPSGHWELDHGVLSFEFTGFNNPLGTSFKRAMRIGDFQGIPLSFNLIHHLVGNLNSATLQFYLGGLND